MTAPASPSSASDSPPNAGTNSPSIRVWVALPPAPWAIVMRSSRNFARLPRAVSMIPRILLLAVGDAAARRGHRYTTSRSRAKRPKL